MHLISFSSLRLPLEQFENTTLDSIKSPPRLLGLWPGVSYLLWQGWDSQEQPGS